MRELEAQIICVDRSFVLCGGRWRRLRKLSKNREHVTSRNRRRTRTSAWNQRGRVQTELDAKWLYQLEALGIGGKVKQELRARLAKQHADTFVWEWWFLLPCWGRSLSKLPNRSVCCYKLSSPSRHIMNKYLEESRFSKPPKSFEALFVSVCLRRVRIDTGL